MFPDLFQARFMSTSSFQQEAGRVLFELAKREDADLGAALRRITEADARKLNVERVGVWLFNADHTAILCEDVYCLGRNRHEKGGELFSSHYPRYFKALGESRTIDASDAQNDPRTSELAEDYLKPLGIISMLDVPVRLRGQEVGVVCHEHVGGQPRSWAPEEQEFVAAIADLVSLALQAQERRKLLSLLQATLEATADGLLVVDLSGKIVSYNHKFVQMWRIPDAIVSTRDDEKALAFVLEQLKDPEDFLKKVRELYAQHEAESFDVLAFKDGRIFERYSLPQRVGDRVVGRVWSFRDVTDRHRAEEALKRANEELQRLNQIKTSFASMISHELKTPLAAIQESVGVIRDGIDGPVSAAQRKTLEIAKLNSEWLGRLINNFLTFTKIESGRMDLRLQPLDARSLVEEACRLMKPAADKKGVHLHKFVPAEAVPVQWDADKMKTLLLNLIDNAVKYTDPPGNIRVRLSPEKDRVRIEVEDTGIGIRDEDKGSIFDLFAQAAIQRPWRTGGFGIGLAICKFMVERHGGSLSVESEYGRGSRFIAFLPANSIADIR
jgi:signal transduction histidine kinase